MKHEVTIRSIDDLDRAAAEFLEKIGDNSLVAFFAPMGSGKTTFTTAICRVLGVTDPVGSPTFAIVNEYMRADGEPMYHFDFYRINKLEEAVEIGLYDYALILNYRSGTSLWFTVAQTSNEAGISVLSNPTPTP